MEEVAVSLSVALKCFSLLLGSLHYRVGKWAAFVWSQLGVPQVSSVVGFLGFSPLYVCLIFYHSSQTGGMLALFCFVRSLKLLLLVIEFAKSKYLSLTVLDIHLLSFFNICFENVMLCTLWAMLTENTLYLMLNTQIKIHISALYEH